MNTVLPTLIITILYLFTPQSFTQITDKDFDHFLGAWEGEGSLFSNQASFTMKWEKSLGDKFYILNFHNEYSNKDGEKVELNATAYYRFIDNSNLSGYWFDSRGVILPLSATFENEKLTTLWGDEHTERGKTVYELTDESIEVSDLVLISEGYRAFGNASYKKSNDN